MNSENNKPYFHLESGILLLGPFKDRHINSVPLDYLKVLYETAPLSNHERRTLGAVIQFKQTQHPPRKKRRRK